MNNSKILSQLGQSIWYDNIERKLLNNGKLQGFIEEGLIYGVTSNPSIFQNSIGGSSDYDDSLQAMSWAGLSSQQIYNELVKEDIQAAADLFMPVYLKTNGNDGFVSLEINPELAYDTQKSIEDARAIWSQINRKNLMIKIPATSQGIPVIKTLIAEGINVNATLIFSIERYNEVIDAYISGLEERLKAGNAIDTVNSVASFFVSRIDTAVDALLNENLRRFPGYNVLIGQIAIDNAKLAYLKFLDRFESERFSFLKGFGAKLQRPLWASTGTKNINYSDTLYVDGLIAKNSVNTVPPQTLEAWLDHGKIDISIDKDIIQAKSRLEILDTQEIDLNQITSDLEKEGVQKFILAYRSLLDTIENKRIKFQKEIGSLIEPVREQLRIAADQVFVSRLFDFDPTLWTHEANDYDEIRNRLGWLKLPIEQNKFTRELEQFANSCESEGYTHVFVLGMGGSSLAPEVMSQAIAPFVQKPGLLLRIVDTTNPDEISESIKGIKLENTLFIVASKSGTTSETLSAMKYFEQELEKIDPTKVGDHFIAITDSGTSLEKYAKERGFKTFFTAPSNVGGRYSVFTEFGLVPTALMGINLETLLQKAQSSYKYGTPDIPYSANPNLMLGIILGVSASSGRNKLTFLNDKLSGYLVPWLEQLIAESSGKEGKGILPIENEPCLESLDYDRDRFFVYLRADGEKDGFASQLREKGYHVVTINLEDPYDLGKEFYRWEYATVVACAIMQVNAFDQPNVQLNKTITKNKILEYQSHGKLIETEPIWENDQAAIYGSAISGILQANTVAEVIKLYAEQAAEGGYIAISAYVQRSSQNIEKLQAFRSKLLHQQRKATTLGFGPRFLHSTGQYHKGGSEGGVFFILTKEPLLDFEVPGDHISFGTLQKAQALGDLEALLQKNRLAIRIHIKDGSLCDLIY